MGPLNKIKKYLAPAKVNLCLHVNGRRDDGYHELCMIMQQVALYDELEFALSSDAGVRLRCDPDGMCPVVDNLVVRAAQALLELRSDGVNNAADNNEIGIEIVLKKHIPVAAGIGGGSSDAATTLMAVNELLNLNLSAAQLHREGLALGADVPFFLFAPVAWATGIGDQLQTVTIEPEFWLLLVNPGVAVSTAQVYNALTSASYSNCEIVHQVASTAALVDLLHNDLQQPAQEICPEIIQAKDFLSKHHAAGCLMSGSGATVFGVYFDEQLAKSAGTALRDEYGWWNMVVAPLDSFCCDLRKVE